MHCPMNNALMSELLLKDTAFQNLMQQRIYNVLLIASPYDAFIMEEDGRVEEQIFDEYVSLNLSSPPRVTRVSDFDAARAELGSKSYDLVIAMPGVDVTATFSNAKLVKQFYPHIPIVVLTPFSREVSRRLRKEDFSGVDYVFSWLGNVDLLVAIIKLLEDKMNAENDITHVGIQMILLVEDSVRFYSSVLPALYRFILQQSVIFSTEALNAHERMLRKRGRPKVMLARDYEEALEIYNRYSDNILGVISDVSFKRAGVKDRQAGIMLAKHLRERDPYLPIIIESSESENRDKVQPFGGTFLDKNSKKLPVDLGKAIMDNFGFGDFIIRNPQTGEEIMRIRNLKQLQNHIFDIPVESLYYHAERNDISRWLYSRALFPVAQAMKMKRFNNLEEAPAVRQLVFDLIVKYRKMKNRGVVAEFKKDQFDKYSNFARIGQGSLGGKGRGLAFIDSIIKNTPEFDDFHGINITIPRTVVLCTDVFDQFMENNALYPAALSNIPDEQILELFLQSRLPDELMDDLMAICDVIEGPLAIRSSSLLEDSHYQPFAGVYATYMIPNLPDRTRMKKLLTDAVKAVYASVFFAESKAYMVATSNVIDQEKMAVIIQELVGTQHGEFYYPSFAGVGRSINYYPVGDEVATDGVVEVAAGLGKYIVDGAGHALRFSPMHPNHVLQTSTVELALRDTQKSIYALNTVNFNEKVSVDEGDCITPLSVQDAAKDGNLTGVISTYDFQNQRIVDNDLGSGRKLVTFANVLKHKIFPLAEATQNMLSLGAKYMGRPVEIEFAGIIGKSPQMSHAGETDKGSLYWLQIRPMVDRSEMLDEEIMKSDPKQQLITTSRALGHGMMDNLRTLILVKSEQFSVTNNRQIAIEIEKINRNFTAQGENYILVGPGRWGSSDEALGIPVRWADISAARLLVEVALPGRAIEPSQGSHFFQNLTSFGAGYFTVDPTVEGEAIDMDFIDKALAQNESQFVKILRFDRPLRVAINGVKGRGIVLKPEADAK